MKAIKFFPYRIPFSMIPVFIFTCMVLFSSQLFSQLAQGPDKFFGCVYPNGPIHQTYPSYWNQLTPENAGKWVYNEIGRDNYDWGGLDAAYNYANQNYLPFKEHTLVWGTSQGEPFWIQSLTPAEQAEEVEEWIQLVGQRYKYMDMVDVVNEPIHEYPGFADALGGSGASGWDWVLWCFEKARQYFPANTKLLINEYNVVNDNSNTNQIINIVNLLDSYGLIDGIGVQAHYFSLRNTNVSVITNNLDQLATTGLPIYVSEMEIDVADDNEQLQEMQRLFPVFWEHPAVKGVTYWGYVEGQMWKVNGYLLRSNGTERPALQWLRSYLAGNGVEELPAIMPADYTLDQNYPNPFNPSTTIRYIMRRSSHVKVTIYDLRGQKVRTLVDAYQTAGEYSPVWDGRNDQNNAVSSSIYFYRLTADDFSQQKKMILIR
jgi:endo-1,4-beta-xylanase